MLSPRRNLSFSVCIKKKKNILGNMNQTRLLPSVQDQSTIKIHHTVYRGVYGHSGGSRTDSPVQRPSTAAFLTAGAHWPQKGLEALAAQVSYSFPSARTLPGTSPANLNTIFWSLNNTSVPTFMHAHSLQISSCAFIATIVSADKEGNLAVRDSQPMNLLWRDVISPNPLQFR